MPGLGVKTHVLRKSSIFFLVLLCSLIYVVSGYSPAKAQAGSEVNAVICGLGAYINITSPPSDTIVTESTTVLKGAVQQATQIEVRIDGVYDSVVPIDVEQQVYEAPVHLTAGTHTITMKAIDSCGTNDSVASVVITYAPAPSTTSDGMTTPTTAGGVVIGGSDGEVVPSSGQGLLPLPVLEAWESLMKWLNIKTLDTAENNAQQLTLLRALTIATGMYLAAIGLATSLVNILASRVPFKGAVTMTERRRIVGRFWRIFGVVLLLLGFFL